ncbi:MGDG synthase family glycosyltransferase [Numidum massiliense]|uniref:MGDG synthase family glycosyltransferase n=1 Tax=Numidum massiliense TaxID=1522315 RepID=UPI0006D5B6A8|nr:glycosyltransferase [Numidum massiliense]
MNKVMIFTETIAGDGHYSAARSLEKAIKTLAPSVEVTLVCGIAHISSKLERAIRLAYLQALRYTPKLWGKAYAQESKWSVWLQQPLGALFANYLHKIVCSEKPDVVVCTHAFCLSAVARLKEIFSFRLGAIITDFSINSFWINPAVEFYFVGHEALRDKLKQMGVQRANVFATGIPIDPLFAEVVHLPKREAKRSVGVDDGRPSILLMGGGLGHGPIKQVIEHIDAAFGDAVQLTVVTGNNELLRNKCEQMFGEAPHIRILGYVDHLGRYLASADLLITKPGGLTTSEALALGIPMLIVAPIPGHEERNSHFLESQQLALRAHDLDDIVRVVRPLLHNLSYYERLAERAKLCGKPEAATAAASHILQMLSYAYD